jgi:hypothetical protein
MNDTASFDPNVSKISMQFSEFTSTFFELPRCFRSSSLSMTFVAPMSVSRSNDADADVQFELEFVLKKSRGVPVSTLLTMLSTQATIFS